MITRKSYAPVEPGQVYGRWTTVREDGVRYKNKRTWLCRCVCGTESVVIANNLHRGKSLSCGCLAREMTTQKKRIVHGHAANGMTTRTYHVWQSMWQRCTNKNSHAYRYYGARGINVCPRWEDLTKFIEDMGECPPGKSIDRKNVDGDYEPKNCRWATPSEQAQNKRTSKLDADAAASIYVDQRRQREIARAFGISPAMVCMIKGGRAWANVTRGMTCP